jgi:hypothetical protein
VAANGGHAYGGAAARDPAASLRASSSSFGELGPGSAAPTPAAHRLGDSDDNDPFAGLAPGLRAALPKLPNGGGAAWPAGVAAPPPTPAGGPPFAGPGALPHQRSAPAPFAVPAVQAAGLPPASAAASATLFGRTPSFNGYDLSAPAAPKPQSSGNPFA